MKGRLVNIISIALIYCGTVFGAGFASGQEIFRFFSMYGKSGIYVSLISAVLFVFFGYVICDRAKQKKLLDSKSYFSFLFSDRVASILSLLCSAFLVVTFCIMIAGCGTLAQEQFGARPVFGAAFSLALCFSIMKNQVGGLKSFHAVVTPFLFIGVTMLCVILCMPMRTGEIVSGGAIEKASVCGGIYISYNLVSVAAVLAPAAQIADSRRDAALGGALGGVLVGVPLVLMTIVLVEHPWVWTTQMPFFTLVSHTYQWATPLCAAILYGAMLTTAVSSGVSVLASVPEKSTKGRVILLCVVALGASLLPFKVLIRLLYTAFGVMGFLLIAGITKSILRK